MEVSLCLIFAHTAKQRIAKEILLRSINKGKTKESQFNAENVQGWDTDWQQLTTTL